MQESNSPCSVAARSCWNCGQRLQPEFVACPYCGTPAIAANVRPARTAPPAPDYSNDALYILAISVFITSTSFFFYFKNSSLFTLILALLNVCLSLTILVRYLQRAGGPPAQAPL